MTWLAWRQHRAEASIVAIMLALLAVLLMITGLEMHQTFQQIGLADCLAHAPALRGSCSDLKDLFTNQHLAFLVIAPFVVLLQLPLGMLLAAPLMAKEVEQRTHLLVWTQSITRFRWLAVKLAFVIGIGLVASGVLMALMIWWFGPLYQITGHFEAFAFDFSGPVWFGSALLAITLGIAAGTLIHRTVLAIFLTMILFLGIRLPVTLLLRPNYEPGITLAQPIGQPAPDNALSPEDGLFDTGYLDAQGNPVDGLHCSSSETVQQCLQTNGIRSQYVTYQPADRFWTFQWIETGIYLGFSVLALGATFWLVRRRLS